MITAHGADRRRLLAGMTAMLAASVLPMPTRAAARWGEADYARATVIDAQAVFGGGDGMSPALTAAIRASGMTAISMTVGRVGSGPDRFHDTVADLARVTQLCLDHPDLLLLVRTAADLVEAKQSQRLGVICNLQDTTPLESDPAHVALFKALGVRVMQLTYNQRNLAGDGAVEPADAGISEYGRQLIAEIEAQRLLLDLSHGGRRTIADAIAASTRPPAISHTGCRALVDFPRNVDDAALRAVADKGGVVGIYLMPFLRAGGQPRAEDAPRHIEHALDICGEDHVGIGTDNALAGQPIGPEAYRAQREFFEICRSRGIAAPGEAPDVLNLVPEYNGPRRFLAIGRDLAQRGHPPRRIDKILGGNFARLFAEVWPD